MAAIHFTQRSEFAAYSYSTEHIVDVLITITAERSVEEDSRAAICLSAAVDRSGSMRQKKLPLVKRTMQFVVRQLCENDKLGLITYETNVNEALPLIEMTAEGKQQGENVVRRIKDGHTTNLSGGLFRSIQQIKDSVEDDDHGNPGPVHAVLLLTDGMANAGITDPTLLESTLARTLCTGPPIKVHTFGYGNDHDGKLLKKLADISGGNYYFIQKDDDVPSSFADALGGLISVIVQNASVVVSPAQSDVKIEKIFTGLRTTQDTDGNHTVHSADLYAEERKDIMVRLRIPALEEPQEAGPLLNVQLSYFDIQAARTVTNEAIVCVKRPEETPENQVADQDFLDQRLRIDVADTLRQAAQLADDGDLDGALRNVNTQMAYVQQNFTSDYSKAAVEDLLEIKDLVSSKAAFSRGGNKIYHTMTAHGTQRSMAYFRSETQTSSIDNARLMTFVDPPHSFSSRHSHTKSLNPSLPSQKDPIEEETQQQRSFLRRMFSGPRISFKRKGNSAEDN